jgi:hypothetical protein
MRLNLPAAARLLVLLAALGTWGGLTGDGAVPLEAQAAGASAGTPATLRVDENIRFEPQGVIVARLVAGTPVRVVERAGQWSRVTFTGTVWEASLQRRTGGSFDLIVSAEEGENLRSGASGSILGRLNPGTLLNERGREPGWIHVERTAWIWHASLQMGQVGETPPAAPAIPETPSQPQGGGAQPTPAAPPSGAADAWVRAGPRGAGVVAIPDGDTLALAREGAELRVLGREGNWARVRLEGWVWLPSTAASEGEGAGATDAVLDGVDPRELARDPERYRGRLVRIPLQFISLERAEAIRSDFMEGEPFLLLRSMDGERTFVYAAVPPELQEAARGLQPLERVEVMGRVRSGAAALTGNPVLELVEFRRIR